MLKSSWISLIVSLFTCVHQNNMHHIIQTGSLFTCVCNVKYRCQIYRSTQNNCGGDYQRGFYHHIAMWRKQLQMFLLTPSYMSESYKYFHYHTSYAMNCFLNITQDPLAYFVWYMYRMLCTNFFTNFFLHQFFLLAYNNNIWQMFGHL